MNGHPSQFAFPPGYFAGETTSWQTAGVILSEVRHPVAKYVAPHVHDAAYFSLLLEGSYAERGEGFDLTYEPYTLVYHDAGTVHQDEMHMASRFFAVGLLDRWSEVIAELGGSRAHVFELHGGDPVWLVLRLYREFLARAESDGDIEPLMYELCSHVAKRSADELKEPQWLSDVEQTIREEFRGPLNLEAIAARAGVHPAHLCRAYRRFHGRTISDARSDLPGIALECGFTDQSHMSRVFKRFTGHAAETFRRDERANLVQD